MAAYVIAQIRIDEPEGYKEYLEGFIPIFASYGGKVVGTSRDTEVVEGSWPFPRTVIMEFPSVSDARAWLDDPEYQALARIRQRTARTNMVVVEGTV